MRQVVVGFTLTRTRREDGWWLRATFGGHWQHFGPYASEDAAIEAAAPLLQALHGAAKTGSCPVCESPAPWMDEEYFPDSGFVLRRCGDPWHKMGQ